MNNCKFILVKDGLLINLLHTSAIKVVSETVSFFQDDKVIHDVTYENEPAALKLFQNIIDYLEKPNDERFSPKRNP